jgi:DNA mismatch endonuclease, patch repair protein
MADVVSADVRSRMMSGIRSTNTKPELFIRRALHALGFRFRLHARDLPGKPDIVLPRHRAVVFVNGCFWHGHDCHLFKWPATRREFWREKISRNALNDAAAADKLLVAGWNVATVWECATKGRTRLDSAAIAERIAEWLTLPHPEREVLVLP